MAFHFRPKNKKMPKVILALGNSSENSTDYETKNAKEDVKAKKANDIAPAPNVLNPPISESSIHNSLNLLEEIPKNVSIFNVAPAQEPKNISTNSLGKKINFQKNLPETNSKNIQGVLEFQNPVLMQPILRIEESPKRKPKIVPTTYSPSDIAAKIKLIQSQPKTYEMPVNQKTISKIPSHLRSAQRTPDGQLAWDHSVHNAQNLYNIRYTILPSRMIFNLASPSLVVKSSFWNLPKEKQKIESIYIEKFNEEIGFYQKLEESIRTQGFRNPILITGGSPRWRGQEEVDPNYLTSVPEHKQLYCEFLGGSRLWLAQKNNWLIPAIITDWTGEWGKAKQISTVDELDECFCDPPDYVYFTDKGLRTTPPPHVHLEPEYQSPQLLSAIRRKIINEDLNNV